MFHILNEYVRRPDKKEYFLKHQIGGFKNVLQSLWKLKHEKT